jgi:processive rubber oxygenase RoxA-like protein
MRSVSRRTIAVALGAFALMLILWVVIAVSRDRPVAYDDITDHFKYGSIGSEPGVSLMRPVGGVLPPLSVFTALPSICPEKLPGGYASLGFIFEKGHTLPVGVSQRRRIGIDHVGLNCAVCHTGTVRDAPDAEPRIVLGMPAHQLDLQRFVEFVLECSLDNRVTAEAVRGRLAQNHVSIGLFERALLRFGLIDRLKLQTLELRNRIAPILGNAVPRWGRGRVDTFNPYKAIQFNWQLDRLPHDELIGASDFPSLWNQKPREGMHLHWDGDNDSVDERNLSAALGAGVTPVTVDHAGIKRVRDWIWTLPPPKYPYSIDASLASRGAALYQQHCVMCHADQRFREGVRAPEATRVGLIEDIDRIRTDRHRLDSYTDVFAANQYALYPESEYRFTHFRKTRGYANHPLDGIWARAPYLHNGSVPTLLDLLSAPAERPKVFYRGNDVFDRQRVGFVSNVKTERGRTFTEYDTALPGNGNGGHEYGISLPLADKLAIVEYMKGL